MVLADFELGLFSLRPLFPLQSLSCCDLCVLCGEIVFLCVLGVLCGEKVFLLSADG